MSSKGIKLHLNGVNHGTGSYVSTGKSILRIFGTLCEDESSSLRLSVFATETGLQK